LAQYWHLILLLKHRQQFFPHNQRIASTTSADTSVSDIRPEIFTAPILPHRGVFAEIRPGVCPGRVS
jgi:hypothetical protein